MTTPTYRNHPLPIEERVEDLLGRLTQGTTGLGAQRQHVLGPR